MKSLFVKSLLITSLILLSSSGLSAQVLSQNEIEKLLIGTWGEGYNILVDSVGNVQKRVSLFTGKSNPSDTSYLDQDLVLNESFEVFTLYQGEKQSYGDRYKVQGDTLILGSRFWRIKQISENNLVISEIPDLMPLVGLSEQGFKRISHETIKTKTKEYSELIKGEWTTISVQPVKTEGSALYGQQVTVTDTISAPITDPIFNLNFSETELSIGQNEIGNLATFEYQIADGMINSNSIHLFSILNLNSETMTLLGMHGTEDQGQPLMIWKLERRKSH